ncbi:MAG: ATP-dependent DNA helicase RecG [Patescibacteria group bacterium]
MLKSPLSKVIRTTANHLHRLKELGINTVEDFLTYFPRAYTDSSEMRKINELRTDEVNTSLVQIRSIFMKKTKTGKTLVRAVVYDETGDMPVLWFNQAHLTRMFRPGDDIILIGKIKFDRGVISMMSPGYETPKKELVHAVRIVPVYHETDLGEATDRGARGRISSKWIREKLHPLLAYTPLFKDFLPEEIKKAGNLIDYSTAIANVHFPKDEDTLNAARRRLAFDELFLLQLAALSRKWQWRNAAHEKNLSMPASNEVIKKFVQKLPFNLTKAQERVVKEILNDMEKSYPMSRLVEGDVGSGKTVVAAIALLNAVANGYQGAVMAPTEVLARQHYHTFMKILQRTHGGINIQFIAGSTPQSAKKDILNQMKTGTVDIVIGTHALIQENVGFKKLGIAVIDEQHRFGVKQREILKSYGAPHLLSLSATPIPRTLALTIYGDQDLSIIDEMPPGRQEIITRVVPESKRIDAYRWVEDQIQKGRQVFVICPLINDSEVLEVKAATEEFDRLKSEIFPQFRLGLLHGRLKQSEKDEVMEGFSKGDIDILVSTAVVEVGIDVPNATIIIIEGSERFGLSQLHQFRGRVGRGEHQSYCFLFPTSTSEDATKRLASLVKHSSGFQLAEIDLQMRGPGEVYGVRQSGIPDLHMATFGDVKLIKESRAVAEKIIEKDPTLKDHPELKSKIAEYENSVAVDY